MNLLKLSNTEFEEYLCKQYPLLYRDFPGLEGIPTGWYPLLDELSSVLESLIDSSNPEIGYMVQCKVKFYTLRFYMAAPTDEQQLYISTAEDKSGNICHICSKLSRRGNRFHNKYIVLCDDCLFIESDNNES